MFALTFGYHDIPPSMAQRMSKKQQRLNYKQYCMSFRRSGDMALTSLMLDKTISTVDDLLASPLARYQSSSKWLWIYRYSWRIDCLIRPPHYSSRLTQPQAKLIILVGKKPQEESLLMNIGKQWNWKLLHWKTFMPGLWFMTPMEHSIMLYPALGHSSANNIQMDGLRSSKHNSVQEVLDLRNPKAYYWREIKGFPQYRDNP